MVFNVFAKCSFYYDLDWFPISIFNFVYVQVVKNYLELIQKFA